MYRIIFNIKHPSRLIAVPLEKIFSFIQDKIYAKKYLKKELKEIYKSNFVRRSAISDFVNFLYDLTIESNPKLIVELGTNNGNSTKAFLAASTKIKNCKMFSVDIQDFSNIIIDNKYTKNWHFFHSDDILFAKEIFKKECDNLKIPPHIDILFIDTSHEYNHTQNELNFYSKFMKKGSKIILHDSNMSFVYKREDNTIGFAFNNKRGVAKAIEEFFTFKFDEKKNLKIETEKFKINHFEHSCGLTVIEYK